MANHTSLQPQHLKSGRRKTRVQSYTWLYRGNLKLREILSQNRKQIADLKSTDMIQIKVKYTMGFQ